MKRAPHPGQELLRALQQEERRYQEALVKELEGVPVEVSDTILQMVREEHQEKLALILSSSK